MDNGIDSMMGDDERLPWGRRKRGTTRSIDLLKGGRQEELCRQRRRKRRRSGEHKGIRCRHVVTGTERRWKEKKALSYRERKTVDSVVDD